jgi:hypothetical protein
MRKRAFVLCLPIVFAAAMLTAEARAATQPPILYDGGLRCLAKKTGVGNCNSASYNARIYVIAKIGFPAKALTTGKTNDIYPVWSPNRKQIAFYSAPTAGLTVGNAIPAFQLWLMNANGTGQHKIGSSLLALGMSGPTWSANGSSIVFAAESPDGKTRDLYSIKTNGTGLTDLTKNPDSVASDYPSESPDGAKIVFRHETTPGFPEAYSIAADGSSSTKLFRGGIMFAWRHDDQQDRLRRELTARRAPGDLSRPFDLCLCGDATHERLAVHEPVVRAERDANRGCACEPDHDHERRRVAAEATDEEGPEELRREPRLVAAIALLP